MTTPLDHDSLFKQLLREFLQEFLEGFFPELAAQLDFSDFGPHSFLSQEQFDDLFRGRSYRIDLVATVRTRDPNGPGGRKGPQADCVILFVEAQQTRRKEFLQRMFHYFALLHLRHRAPVIPVVIYTDSARWSHPDRWQQYTLEFGGKRILDFQFFALKPNTLPVRPFLRSTNPAQLALAAKMGMAGEDLAEVKLGLLRQILRSRQSEPRKSLLATFVDTYIEEDDETARREEELLTQREYKETGMLLERARQRGIAEGEAKGEARGVAIGEAKGKRETAAKMKEHGIPLATICQITGLSQEEVAALT
jgi:predicted transposase/invertase (TIGR01784 family)